MSKEQQTGIQTRQVVSRAEAVNLPSTEGPHAGLACAASSALANDRLLVAIGGACQGNTVNLRELLEQFEKGTKNKHTKITRTKRK